MVLDQFWLEWHPKLFVPVAASTFRIVQSWEYRSIVLVYVAISFITAVLLVLDLWETRYLKFWRLEVVWSERKHTWLSDLWFLETCSFPQLRWQVVMKLVEGLLKDCRWHRCWVCIVRRLFAALMTDQSTTATLLLIGMFPKKVWWRWLVGTVHVSSLHLSGLYCGWATINALSVVWTWGVRWTLCRRCPRTTKLAISLE